MKALLITTQNLENYNMDGGNAWKFKGGSDYIVSFKTEELIYEEDVYGKGLHSYYEAPEVSEASIIAVINQIGNAGSEGYQSYVRNVEEVSVDHVTEDEIRYGDEPEALKLFSAERLTWKELQEKL